MLVMSTSSSASKAARALGKRSAQLRRQEWGEEEFLNRMKEIGKLGGRPRKKSTLPIQPRSTANQLKVRLSGDVETGHTKGVD